MRGATSRRSRPPILELAQNRASPLNGAAKRKLEQKKSAAALLIMLQSAFIREAVVRVFRKDDVV